MPDNGIRSRVQKIVFGISVRSLFLQITQQLFVPDNNFANKKIFGRVVLEYSGLLDQTALGFALNDDLVPPVLFQNWLPSVGNKIGQIRSDLIYVLVGVFMLVLLPWEAQ